MNSHKDLDVWRAAITLAKGSYGLTRALTQEERYGLSSHMRKSVVSIASNIAEGSARQGAKEQIQFLYVALGSANELDTQLEIAREAGMLPADRVVSTQKEVTRITMMLRGMIRALKARTK